MAILVFGYVRRRGEGSKLVMREQLYSENWRWSPRPRGSLLKQCRGSGFQCSTTLKGIMRRFRNGAIYHNCTLGTGLDQLDLKPDQPVSWLTVFSVLALLFRNLFKAHFHMLSFPYFSRYPSCISHWTTVLLWSGIAVLLLSLCCYPCVLWEMGMQLNMASHGSVAMDLVLLTHGSFQNRHVIQLS